jgi:catechol 2,3-dioxygenase-like lactoylglutathione lyase family enzyme
MEMIARVEFFEPKNERKGEIGMIGVRKISHASYETPDLDKQTEYYTDILGLTLVAREKNAVYLANTIEHHSVILRKGSEPKCTRLGFQIGPDEDLDAFEKQTAAHGLRTSRKKGAEPTIDDMIVFEDPKGGGHRACRKK